MNNSNKKPNKTPTSNKLVIDTNLTTYLVGSIFAYKLYKMYYPNTNDSNTDTDMNQINEKSYKQLDFGKKN